MARQWCQRCHRSISGTQKHHNWLAVLERQSSADERPWESLRHVCAQCLRSERQEFRWLRQRIKYLENPERPIYSWGRWTLQSGLTLWAGFGSMTSIANQLMAEGYWCLSPMFPRGGRPLPANPINSMVVEHIRLDQLEIYRSQLRCMACRRQSDRDDGRWCRSCYNAWRSADRPRGEAWLEFVDSRRRWLAGMAREAQLRKLGTRKERLEDRLSRIKIHAEQEKQDVVRDNGIKNIGAPQEAFMDTLPWRERLGMFRASLEGKLMMVPFTEEEAVRIIRQKILADIPQPLRDEDRDETSNITPIRRQSA